MATTPTTQTSAPPSQISQIYNSLQGVSKSLGTLQSAKTAGLAITPNTTVQQAQAYTANQPTNYTSTDNSSANYFKDAPGYTPNAAQGDKVGTPADTSQPSPTTTQIQPPNAPPKTPPVVPGSGNAFTGNNLSSLGDVGKNIEQQVKAGLDIAKSSKIPSPQNSGGGGAGVNGAMSNPSIQTPTPPSPAVQNFFDPNTNPNIQEQQKQLREMLSPEADRKALNDHITQLASDRADLAGLKTDLMNTKRVMAGTENDLRDEITKAGGFATESQVQALTIARNKTLVARSQQLTDQIQSQTDLVNSDVSLVGDEKQLAATQFSQRMSLLQYQQENTKNAVNAALQSYNKLIDINPAGLLASLKADPTQAARFQSITGLSMDALSGAASAHQLDILNKQLTNQKLAGEIGKETPGTTAYNSNQDKLEQQYRQVLLKEASNRSGDLGIQNSKVSQAIHLTSLLNQYKDSKGNYNVPQAQYSELVFGLANLLSPNGSTSEGDRAKLQSLTAAGNLKSALQFITGTPQNGNTQAIIKNLADSIDRQGGVAEDLRGQAVNFLQGLAPTGLDQSRIDALNKNGLPSYSTYKQTGQVGDKAYVAPKLLAPEEIPSGYYQASDGLLYKK